MISTPNVYSSKNRLILFVSITLSTSTLVGMEEPLYTLKVNNFSQSPITVTTKMMLHTNRKDIHYHGVFNASPNKIRQFQSTYPLFTITVPNCSPSCFDIWITDRLKKSEHITISEFTYAPEHGNLIKINDHNRKELATLYAINTKIKK